MSPPVPRKGFRLDTDLCTGCGACAVACAVENELPWGTSWRWIETFNPRHLPGLPSYHLSLACNHCADAPCMEHCPALAYGRDLVTGAVLLDPDKCIGCRYCTWACPYDAPKFDTHQGVVGKCTFCHHRQLEGLTPACVQQCPTGALTWGDLDALEGAAAIPGFPATDAEPSIRFGEPRGGPVEADGAHAPSLGCFAPRGTHKTSLATEGPLVVFTLVVATLTGIMATGVGRAFLGLPSFLLLAAIAGGASTLHLGRKGRAWRALLNVRRSWLSREVVLFSLFVAASVVVLSPAATPGWAGYVVSVLGFALLVAVDRVYAVTCTRELGMHSAGVLLTGVMVTGIVAGSPVVWGGALAAKVVSYTVRKARFFEERRPVRGSWTVLRLGTILVASGVLIVAADPAGVARGPLLWVAVALLGLGEVVDRGEFYLELEVSTPRAAMGKALTERAGIQPLAA